MIKTKRDLIFIGGRSFNSIAECAKEFGISEITLCTRIRRWGRDNPKVLSPTKTKKDKQIDMLGHHFRNKATLARHYGIPYHTFMRRFEKYKKFIKDNHVPDEIAKKLVVKTRDKRIRYKGHLYHVDELEGMLAVPRKFWLKDNKVDLKALRKYGKMPHLPVDEIDPELANLRKNKKKILSRKRNKEYQAHLGKARPEKAREK